MQQVARKLYYIFLYLAFFIPLSFIWTKKESLKRQKKNNKLIEDKNIFLMQEEYMRIKNNPIIKWTEKLTFKTKNIQSSSGQYKNPPTEIYTIF